jgi:hypothetical protein
MTKLLFRVFTDLKCIIIIIAIIIIIIIISIIIINGKVNYTVEQATKAQRGLEVLLYFFFNLGARRGWVVNATTRPLYHLERLGTHCIGSWVGPRAGLDV